MSRRKKVVVWAVVYGDSEIYDVHGRCLATDEPTKQNLLETFDTKPTRVVKLVEADVALAKAHKATWAALQLAYHHLDRFGCVESRIPDDPIIPSQERFFEAYHEAKRLEKKRGGR